MKRRILHALGATVVIVAASGTSQAQQAETVQSLISKGYVVVSSFEGPAGPGIFLQRADSLYFCLATETPNSTDVRTQYCKPVH
jgi:cysteine synthase